MNIALITKKSLSFMHLPKKVSGQYWVTSSIDGKELRVMSVETKDGEWLLKSNKDYRILASDSDGTGNKYVKDVILKPRHTYCIDNNQIGKSIILVEPEEESQAIYTKYIIRPGCDISVGRSSNADIKIDHGAVSNEHCTLRFEDNKWVIVDKSRNGTFINRKSVAENAISKHTENGRTVYIAEAFFGDVVYVFGITIILSNGFIACNNPYGSVEIKTEKLKPLQPEKVVYPDEDYNYEMKEKDFFYRSPRFKRDIEKAVFKVDPPPESPMGDEMPLMLVLGPSITMGMASMSTALFAVNNAIQNGNISAALPSVIMSVSMLMGTVTWPIITKNVEKRRKKKKEEKRQKKYRQYLNEFLACVQEAEDMQTEILNENFADITKYEDTILSADSTLWERSMVQNDFLTVRVGTGECDLDAEISYSDRKFSIDDDNLRDEMYMLCEGEKKLRNIPITYSIFEDYISGIIGTEQNNIEFAKQIITQISAMYGYDEVKMIFIYDENQAEQLEFVKWLPHVWSNDNSFRFIATSERELKEISAYLEPVLQYRKELSDEDVAETLPVYIVMSFSKKLAVKASFIEKIFAAKKNIHFCVISLYEEMPRLPKECTKIIYLNGADGKIYDKNDISGEYISFSLDPGVQTPMADICKKLANIKLDIQDDANKLPGMITFLEMMGVGRIDHLNSLSRWKENDPTKTLETPVGVDTAGNHFMLDLHEKFHGPHGLVAGMTGSGKSEFIITYILSLAVNYHPNEVAFILIDYKGGGMANSFGRLPHTAGIITNLDGASIKRSLTSIESELKRRQAIFVKVSAEIGVSNIDIYTYQKLYREGKVTEPLQHLFIISDEFAELKQQQPEFMAQLISAARIGRSLGVHLILATQKPNGVVDDQIWSNSRFRICLKVQERADSMDMLKRPDAAELKETGRFFLQVGYNELFEIGQSAWSGASYIPSDRVEKEKDTSVIAIDNNGRVIKQMRAAKKKVLNNSGKKQLDGIVDYLCKIAEEEKIAIRPLWLEPIPPIITIDELANKYGKNVIPYYINPIIGEYDDPVNQKQGLLTLPLSDSGNTIVYGSAGNGKTTFINAMLYSLIHEHTADEVNLYVLDFASETLKCFAKAPQVGDVVFINENEKVVNLFKLLNGEVKKRKKAFSSFGGDYNSFIHAQNRPGNFPMIVVVIHNFAAFTEVYEDRVGSVAYLSREGSKYGINFVITATGSNTVSYRLMQNFKQMFVMQLNDETEYASLLGKTDGLVPAKIKGRGLVKIDRLYEFQTAHVVYESDRDGMRIPISPIEFIEKECIRIRNSWNGEFAARIPILADVVDAELLEDYVSKGNLHRVPIGIETASLKPCLYPFGADYLTFAISYDDGYKDFSYKLASFINNNVGTQTHYIDISGEFMDEPAEGMNCYYKSTDIEPIIDKLFNTALERNKIFKQAVRDGIKAEGFEPVVIVISGLYAVREILGDLGKEQLDTLLWKGNADYNMYVIICDSLNNFTNATRIGNWFKANGNKGNFIWIGNGLGKQYILDFDRTGFADDDIKSGFGYAIINQKWKKVKLLGADRGDEGNEE